MKLKTPLFRTLLCASLLALTAGCVHTMDVSSKPTVLPAGNKLPLNAVLVLNKDFVGYKYQYAIGGDIWAFPFGPSLQDYARQEANASFRQVNEALSIEEASTNSSADIVLIPRAVKTEASPGKWAWDSFNLTLVIEWTAKDRATQNTVWLKTITATASKAKAGKLLYGPDQLIITQNLFDDLNTKTYEAFQNAPELRGRQP